MKNNNATTPQAPAAPTNRYRTKDGTTYTVMDEPVPAAPSVLESDEECAREIAQKCLSFFTGLEHNLTTGAKNATALLEFCEKTALALIAARVAEAVKGEREELTQRTRERDALLGSLHILQQQERK